MSTGDETIIAWKCKGVLDESIFFFPHTAGNNSAPKLKWFSNSKIEVEFTGSCLKQDKTTLSHGNVVHLFIVYEVNTKFVCNCFLGL